MGTYQKLTPSAAATTAPNKPKAGTSTSLNLGTLIWRTPSGRSYTTTPTEYPV
jgi:hypothetical protein